jgi:hypothetical protein
VTASLVADPLPPRPRLAPPTCTQPNGAHEHVITATTMYREMDMGFWLEQAEAEVKGLA